MERGDVTAAAADPTSLLVGEAASCGRVLILSNGHGEDVMGARLGEALQSRGLEVIALPIVGEGAAYRSADISLAYEGRALPSGGFAWRSGGRAVLGDLRAGFWSEWRGQRAALRREAAQADLLIGVGDSVVVGLVAFLRTHPPFLFLPAAKSVYNSRFYAFERRWMSRHCRAIYPRDRETAISLRRAGLPAHFVGNLMMDLLEPKGGWPPATDLDGTGLLGASADAQSVAATAAATALRPGLRRVALLPGSRDEAYANLQHMLRVIEAVERARPGHADFAVALSGGLNAERLEEIVQGAGWQLCGAYWEGPSARTAQVADSPGRSDDGGPRLYPVRGAFPDVLRWAEVVLGMAGTASEQAVGLGRPVVSFAGTGPQFTRRFAEGQRRLLGQSVSLVPREESDRGSVAAPERVAQELLSVLGDEERRSHMAAVGRARMGEAGGAARVAEGAVRVLEPKSPLMSVIIPTYNRQALLEQVLDSLADQVLPERKGASSHPFEVVVVDDGSTDGTPDWCEQERRRYPFPLRLVSRPHLGRAHARNAGIRAARGELVILLDSDVVVSPGFVAAHARVHKLDEGWPVPCGMVGRGPVVHVADPVEARHQGVGVSVKDLSNAFFATANVSVAREHLAQAGLFDEDFQEYGWEDLELGRRLKRLGLRKAKAEGAIGYHYAEPFRVASLSGALAKERERGHTAVLYNQKHDHWEVRTSTLAFPAAFWTDRLLNVGGWADRPDAVERLRALEARGRHRTVNFLGKRLLFHTYMNGMREAGIGTALRDRAQARGRGVSAPDGGTNS